MCISTFSCGHITSLERLRRYSKKDAAFRRETTALVVYRFGGPSGETRGLSLSASVTRTVGPVRAARKIEREKLQFVAQGQSTNQFSSRAPESRVRPANPTWNTRPASDVIGSGPFGPTPAAARRKAVDASALASPRVCVCVALVARRCKSRWGRDGR